MFLHFVAALLLSCMAAQDPKPEPLPQGAVVRMGSAATKTTGYHGNTEGVAFTADGKTLASLSGAVRLWDLASGQETLVLDTGGQTPVYSLAMSPDGKRIAWGDYQKGIVIRDLTTGKDPRILTMSADAFGSNYASHLLFSRDGSVLLSASGDKKIVLWDVASGKPVKELNHHGVRFVGWSADEKILVSGGYQDKSVRVWDVASGKELFQLDGEGDVAISPDGRRIAYSGTDRKPWMWEIDPAKDPQASPVEGEVRRLAGLFAGRPDAGGLRGWKNRPLRRRRGQTGSRSSRQTRTAS